MAKKTTKKNTTKKNNSKKTDEFTKKNIKKQLKNLKTVGDELILTGKHRHHIILFNNNEYYHIFNDNIINDDTYNIDNMTNTIYELEHGDKP